MQWHWRAPAPTSGVGRSCGCSGRGVGDLVAVVAMLVAEVVADRT